MQSIQVQVDLWYGWLRNITNQGFSTATYKSVTFSSWEKANAGTSVMELSLRSLQQKEKVGGADNIQPRPLRKRCNSDSKLAKRTTYTFQNPGHSHEFISLGTYLSRWEVQSMVPVRVLHKQSSGHAQPSGYCATAKLARETSAAANPRRTKAIFQLNFVFVYK